LVGIVKLVFCFFGSDGKVSVVYVRMQNKILHCPRRGSQWPKTIDGMSEFAANCMDLREMQ